MREAPSRVTYIPQMWAMITREFRLGYQAR